MSTFYSFFRLSFASFSPLLPTISCAHLWLIQAILTNECSFSLKSFNIWLKWKVDIYAQTDISWNGILVNSTLLKLAIHFRRLKILINKWTVNIRCICVTKLWICYQLLMILFFFLTELLIFLLTVKVSFTFTPLNWNLYYLIRRVKSNLWRIYQSHLGTWLLCTMLLVQADIFSIVRLMLTFFLTHNIVLNTTCTTHMIKQLNRRKAS